MALFAFVCLFSFLALPLYSLVHEAEHSLFHPDRRINDAAGVLLAAFFGGPFSFLRACHLGHHRRNRTKSELFDVIEPGDSPAKKRFFFYAMYTGGFWLTVPLAMVPLLFWPSLLKSDLVQSSVSASAMVNGIPRHFILRIRAECLFVILLHTALVYFLDLNVWIYLLMLFAGGVNWSSQQYVPHAHSPQDVLNGAHNLRASRMYQTWLLHFNWHLAHHQNPNVPWLYLPMYNDPSRERPGYAKSFLLFWKGPRRAEARSRAPQTRGY
jgi:fatty acid desaturase